MFATLYRAFAVQKSSPKLGSSYQKGSSIRPGGHPRACLARSGTMALSPQRAACRPYQELAAYNELDMVRVEELLGITDFFLRQMI
jgi:hypothetical protein